MTNVEEISIFANMDTVAETMGERLQWARKNANFSSARQASIAIGVGYSTYNGHENGQNQFKEPAAKHYGKAFNVSWLWLLHGGRDPKPTPEDIALYATMPKIEPVIENVREVLLYREPNASFPPKYKKFPDGSVPLLGQTVGGANGKFVLNGQEVSRVFCPPDLEGVDGAYAVQVYGTSMEPKFEAGETVWLHPFAPVRSGDYVVAQIHTKDGEPPESYIKRFVSRSSQVLRLNQLNPEEGESREMEFPADKVVAIHKIVFHALV